LEDWELGFLSLLATPIESQNTDIMYRHFFTALWQTL